MTWFTSEGLTTLAIENRLNTFAGLGIRELGMIIATALVSGGVSSGATLYLVLSGSGMPGRLVSASEFDALKARVASLETTTKASAQIVDANGVITASGLRIQSKDGKQQIELTAIGGGTSINLGGSVLRPHISILENDAGASIILNGEDGSSANIGLIGTGSPYFALRDRNQKERFSAYLGIGDAPQLELSDEAGRTRTSIGKMRLVNHTTGTKTELAESSIVLFGSNERVIWTSPGGRED